MPGERSRSSSRCRSKSSSSAKGRISIAFRAALARESANRYKRGRCPLGHGLPQASGRTIVLPGKEVVLMKRVFEQGIEWMPAPSSILTEESPRTIGSPWLRSHWRLLRRILTRLPDAKRVAQGPFEGMGYLPVAASSHTTLPMLLGTYECELHPAIRRRSAERGVADRIIDIGAGRRLLCCRHGTAEPRSAARRL